MLSLILNDDGDDDYTFEPHSVAFQAVHGLLEKSLAGGRHSRDIILIPFNGSVDVLEDLLDRVRNFCADTVSRNERDLYAGIRNGLRIGTATTNSVDTAIFCG
jgi:hypothetical protein